jgi:hypothetical protein
MGLKGSRITKPRCIGSNPIGAPGTNPPKNMEIVESQKVIATGPYAIVRHSMYAGGLLLLLWNALGARFLLGTRCVRGADTGASLASP